MHHKVTQVLNHTQDASEDAGHDLLKGVGVESERHAGVPEDSTVGQEISEVAAVQVPSPQVRPRWQPPYVCDWQLLPEISFRS